MGWCDDITTVLRCAVYHQGVLGIGRYVDACIAHLFSCCLMRVVASDMSSSTGFPNAAGLYSRASHLADNTATAVTRMQHAGFIIMGITNTSELCMWIESNNTVYG